jgi:hypothetical protein
MAQACDPRSIVDCRKEEQEIKTDIETRTEESDERGNRNDSNDSGSYNNISPQ